MGSHVVKVPDVGEGVAEVELVSWAVAVGQEVSRNEILAEVMTDKANVEIPSPVAGVIATLTGEIGSTLAVGSLLVELTVEGDDSAPSPLDPLTSATGNGAASVVGEGRADQSPEASEPVESAAVVGLGRAGPELAESAAGAALLDPGPPRPEGERPRAAPAVRHRARQAGVDLRRVPGTGPAGRITHDDLDRYHRQDRGAPPAGGNRLRETNTTVEEHPIVGIRRKIAERMVASTTSIPHITYVEEVDVTGLEQLRETLNERRSGERTRLTVLPFLVRALVKSLPDFPRMNAHVDDERGVLSTFGGIHVGIATQTPNGLVVPVIRHAEALSLWTIADQLNALAEAARSGRAAPADLRGSTITITSLGALGGLVTTPVINKPEVAIVGVNKIAIRPVWADNGFVPRKLMNLSSSFDHRVVDGWDAALFVQSLKQSLEQPALLFIDE